jgi:hypothetical protein
MAITDLGVLRGWGGHDLVDRDGVKAGSISPGRSGVATPRPHQTFSESPHIPRHPRAVQERRSATLVPRAVMDMDLGPTSPSAP